MRLSWPFAKPDPQSLSAHTSSITPLLMLCSAVGAGSGHLFSVENNYSKKIIFPPPFYTDFYAEKTCVGSKGGTGQAVVLSRGSSPQWGMQDCILSFQAPGRCVRAIWHPRQMDFSCQSRKLLAPKMFSWQQQGSKCCCREGRYWASMVLQKVLCCHILENSVIKTKDFYYWKSSVTRATRKIMFN